MEYNSKNMNYIFNVEYFEELNDKYLLEKENKENEEKIKINNEAISGFKFNSKSMKDELKASGIEISSFSLYTIYPGLLAGIGNIHRLPIKGEIQTGFNFDYVTGVPYIPGSSIKGLLRSYFPEDGKRNEDELKDYILSLLKKDKAFDLKRFLLSVFDQAEASKKYNFNFKTDIFLGAYPSNLNNQEMLEMEYITHHKDKFKNPIPISMIKVKGGVEFDFCFILNDYYDEKGELSISAKDKLDLFKKIILDMGAGAKTNTGFGQFSEKI